MATQTHQSLQAHGGIRPAAMRLGLRRLHRLQRSSDAPHLQRRHGNRAARGIVGDAPRGEVCRNRGWEDERKSQPYFSPTAGRIVSIALPKMCKSARHPLGRHACRKQNSNDEKQAFNHLRQRKIKCNSMARHGKRAVNQTQAEIWHRVCARLRHQRIDLAPTSIAISARYSWVKIEAPSSAALQLARR